MGTPGEAAEGVAAARQAAVIFVLAGLFTLTAVPSTPVAPLWVLVVAGSHLAAAAVSWFGPWERWGLTGSASLAPVALVLLSLTTWAFDGFASGLGPLFVLVFAWLGLHHPRRLILAVAPLTAAGFVTALVAADARPRSVASTLVLVPIAVTVGLVISRTVGLLRETERELQVRDRWRAALMATLAHDVRSPLATVVGVLEILGDDPESGPRHRRLLDSATRQTNRVLRLSRGILEVERVEQGRLRLDVRRVDLAAAARDVADLTEPEHVRVDVPSDLVVVADGERVEQILFNLTSNALRHGRPPVVIGGRRHAGQVEIWVRDHGDGVPVEDVPSLFDRFSSVDRSPQSVGLGLWIVRTLVDSHGGSVRYEAGIPGARFVVTLPDSAGAGVPDAAPTATSGPGQG